MARRPRRRGDREVIERRRHDAEVLERRLVRGSAEAAGEEVDREARADRLSESTSRVILRIACSYERSGLCRYQERTLVASWSKTMPKTVPAMRGANAGALRPHCALGIDAARLEVDLARARTRRLWRHACLARACHVLQCALTVQQPLILEFASCFRFVRPRPRAQSPPRCLCVRHSSAARKAPRWGRREGV